MSLPSASGQLWGSLGFLSASTLLPMSFFQTILTKITDAAISSSPASTNAHVRYPTSSSRSTSPGVASSPFDSLSRTIRGYVPSAAPSAPRVSRPVSYASFSGNSAASVSQVAVPVYATDQARASPRPYAAARVERQEFERDYERAGAGEDEGAYYGYGGYPTSPPPPHPAMMLPAPIPARPRAPAHQQQGHQRQHSTPGRFMGSGLAQAIRRGAAAGASVVGARGLQSPGGSTGKAHVGDVAGRGEENRVMWARWDFLNGR